jgi:hypothetical protein
MIRRASTSMIGGLGNDTGTCIFPDPAPLVLPTPTPAPLLPLAPNRPDVGLE